MKKFLFALLLGFCTILPTGQAMSHMVVQSRIVTVTIEGWTLHANSDAESGAIQNIQIYSLLTGNLVREQSCGGYSCSLSLQGLLPATYVAFVVTNNTVVTKKFKLF